MGIVLDAIKDAALGPLGLGGEQFATPAEAPALVINELSGRKRAIVLRGRMLPFRRPKWSGAQRSEVTYYPGNPEGTLQIFGPMSEPTTLTGLWHERYISAAGLEVKGFDFPASVEDLVKIFDEFRKSGSVLDVQWSFIRRRGHLKRFAVMPDRVEDMEWEAEFEWFSDGTLAPQVLGIPFDLNAIASNMNALSDIGAFGPIDILQAYEAAIFQQIANLQALVDDFIAKAQVLANLQTLPARVVQGVKSAAMAIAGSVSALTQDTSERDYTYAQTTDNAEKVVLMQVFQRNLAFFGIALRDNVLSASQNLEDRAEQVAIRIAVMDQSGSLRVLAQREYGNADAWTILADANGFDSARVPPGTEVVIPPAGSGATGIV